MKIYTLMENTVKNDDFCCEHGLSLYVQTAKHKLLFDTGGSAAFAANAAKLGVDLSQVDICIVSHGHNDHGGGLAKFLELNSKAPIYISRFGFERHFSGTEREISIPATLQETGRFILVDDYLQIDEELELCSCNNKQILHFADSFGLNMLQGDQFVPDDFRHEQYLTLHENGRKVLLSGCSHKGILNIMAWLKPDICIGGFHFMKLSTTGTDEKVLQEAANELESLPAEYYTCHCTGQEQYAYLAKRMTRLHYLAAGDVLEI